MRRTCKFPGCGRDVWANELCRAHNLQQWKGKPLVALYSRIRPPGSAPRIEFVEMTCPRTDLKGPCHVFSRSKTDKGYGQVRLNGTMVLVHVYVWKRDIGPIPDGMMIDHQCRVRACCNVDHLRVVTPKVNATENIVGANWQIEAARTHCKFGHPFDEHNTYRRLRGGRTCRTCQREGHHRRKAMKT